MRVEKRRTRKIAEAFIVSHRFSAKHLSAYLDETEWRFNNPDNDFLFRDTLIRLVSAEALPFAELVGETDLVG